jgi:hypothetical protein
MRHADLNFIALKAPYRVSRVNAGAWVVGSLMPDTLNNVG